jgi:regulator of protease activity HflC (stomatin/prohibitin superfamily)
MMNRIKMDIPWKNIGWIGFVILGLLVIFALSFMVHRTGSTEVGVRTVKWSITGKKGVVEKPYMPGAVYFFLPIINDWHTFDTKLQNMYMTKQQGDDLLFKTIDGNDISLDVIISYRIDPNKASLILQKCAQSNRELAQKIVRPVSRSKTRDIFGELTTEEFYVAEKRAEKAEKAVLELNRILNQYGVIVEKVLTKDYRFNEAYQKAIADKKVADQLAEKNKAATKAAYEEYQKRLREAEGEVNKMIAKADGEFLKAKIEADAYYEKQKMLAEAIEAEAVAEAKGITEMNRALSGAGGETMVKLKIAEALAGKKIILLPLGKGGFDIKTTDINKLLELYGTKRLTEEEKKEKR